jgi:hypothetical protein
MIPWTLTPNFPFGNPYWTTSGFKSPGWSTRGEPNPSYMQAGISDLGTFSSPAISALKTEGYFKTGTLQFTWYASTPFISDNPAEFWVRSQSGNNFISKKILAIGGYQNGNFQYIADPIMFQPGFSYASGDGNNSLSLWNNNINFSGKVIYSITGSGFYSFEWIYKKTTSAGYNDPINFGTDTVILSGVTLPEYYTPQLGAQNLFDVNFLTNFKSGQLFISYDSGKTFEKNNLDTNWNSVCINGDKSILLATNNSNIIFKSIDSGKNWNNINNFNNESFLFPFESNVKLSNIVTSKDGYNTFMISSQPSLSRIYNRKFYPNENLYEIYEFWPGIEGIINDIDICSNGKTGLFITDEPSNNIYRFTSLETPLITPIVGLNKTGQCLAVSKKDNSPDDGKFQIIGTDNDYLYLSTNFGSNWFPVLTDKKRNWVDVDILDNKIIAAENNGRIFYSQDTGVTWNNIDLNINCKTVRLSNSAPYLILITSTIGNVYTGTNLNNLSKAFLPKGSWINSAISYDNSLQIIIKDALDEVRVDYSNLYSSSVSEFSTNTNIIYGYGDINVKISGSGFGIITGVTGKAFQDAILIKTGLLTNTLTPADFGISTWDLNLEETGSLENVFLNFVSSNIQATGIIEFIDFTGSGLTIGDAITFTDPVGSTWSYNYDTGNENNDANIFTGVSHLTELLNLDDALGAFQDNNKIYVYDTGIFLGEETNLYRIIRTCEDINAIKIPNRYFQGGISLRDPVEIVTGIFSINEQINVEMSGFYSTEQIVNTSINVSGIEWINSFITWSVITGITVENSFLTNTGQLPFQSFENIFTGYSGQINIPIQQKFDLSPDFIFSASRRNPNINLYTGYILYKVSVNTDSNNNQIVYSGILKG